MIAPGTLLSVLAATAVAAMPLLLLWRLRRCDGTSAGLHRRLEPIIFLFHDQILNDATAPARDLAERNGIGDLAAMMSWLAPQLPEAATALVTARREGRGIASGHLPDNAAALRALFQDLGGDMLRITLCDPRAESAGTIVDALSLAALENEAAILRETANAAPVLAWRQKMDGTLTWANAAYVACCEVRGPDEGLWPLPRLIDLDLLALALWEEDGSPPAQRRQLELDGRNLWFDCHIRPGTRDEMLVYALPADNAVQAERNLREFVQTLTKTFADLPIGLAIFDRDRHLQLFNPALIDLTGLPTGFLSARPSLFGFLDRLREARMVPEPRDYRSWRKHMSTLEAGAASGHHVETWSLPGGQTYRVTGRPHADGGVAFLLEDITSEITLTRRFRADLAMHGQLLDALEDAVAVIAGDGRVVLSNSIWTRICGSEKSLPALVAHWSPDRGGGGAGSGRLLEAVSTGGARTTASGALVGPHGAPFAWRVSPMQGGQMMISLRANPAAAPAEIVPAAEAAAPHGSGVVPRHHPQREAAGAS